MRKTVSNHRNKRIGQSIGSYENQGRLKQKSLTSQNIRNHAIRGVTSYDATEETSRLAPQQKIEETYIAKHIKQHG
jgi:hypothetical protein